MNENGQAEKDSSGEEILIENLAHPCHKNNLSRVLRIQFLSLRGMRHTNHKS